MHALSINPTVL